MLKMGSIHVRLAQLVLLTQLLVPVRHLLANSVRHPGTRMRVQLNAQYVPQENIAWRERQCVVIVLPVHMDREVLVRIAPQAFILDKEHLNVHRALLELLPILIKPVASCVRLEPPAKERLHLAQIALLAPTQIFLGNLHATLAPLVQAQTIFRVLFLVARVSKVMQRQVMVQTRARYVQPAHSQRDWGRWHAKDALLEHMAMCKDCNNVKHVRITLTIICKAPHLALIVMLVIKANLNLDQSNVYPALLEHMELQASV